MTNEEAKAAQEIAKVTGESIKVGQDVLGFFKLFIGDSPKEVGEIVTAWTRFYKFKNFLAIYDKVQAIVTKRNKEGKLNPLPARIVIPLLEAATQESDNGLQEKWAKLLVNAADPGTSFEIRKVFVSILSELEPLDASVLDFVPNYSQALIIEDSVRKLKGMKVPEMATRLHSSESNILLSLHNLIRLGCVGYHRNIDDDMLSTMGFGLPSLETDAGFWATELGHALRSACRD
jgi:Abortive infection alpha